MYTERGLVPPKEVQNLNVSTISATSKRPTGQQKPAQKIHEQVKIDQNGELASMFNNHHQEMSSPEKDGNIHSVNTYIALNIDVYGQQHTPEEHKDNSAKKSSMN